MKRRGELSLGDVLSAFDRLRPADAESRRLLLRMLDPQGLMSGLRDERLDGREAAPPRKPRLLPPVKPVSEKPSPNPVETSAPEPAGDGEVIPTLLRQLEQSPPLLQLPGPDIQVLERPPASLPVLPPPAPLFVPAWHTGILTAALGVPQPEGALDVPRAVSHLARQRPVKTLPRRQVRSLRLGVRVLVDVSESMVPFAQDRKQLLACVQAVVGPEHTEVHQFESAPSRGVRPKASAEFQPFEPPPSGTPVLVLSDLGLGASPLSTERAEVAEWLRFGEVAHRAGCRVVVLVPYSPSRWPRALQRRMRLIHWDRHTTARTVLQALQR